MEPLGDPLPSEITSITSLDHPKLERKPSLLPAFEPLSSSPLPRPRSMKRKYGEHSPSKPQDGLKFYPTPVPTSSTGILPSSPPARSARPSMHRTMSTMSQRTALTAVPTLELPHNGDTIRMGRSGNSSDYQLSTNRLISRVHIEASYHAASASHPYGEIIIKCLGWNGATVHSRGQRHELAKGDNFASDTPSVEIMLDIQDARVIIAFPHIIKDAVSVHSDNLWNADSPARRRISVSASPRHVFASSPPPLVPQSPISPTPGRFLDPSVSVAFLHEGSRSPSGEVRVYEDEDAGAEALENSLFEKAHEEQLRSGSGSTEDDHKDASEMAEGASSHSEEFSDHNEENDPIIHSFGPFGENLLPRLASFNTQATPQQPQRPRKPLKSPTHSPQQPSASITAPRFNESPIKNHVINQLAFSRIHSIPISTIISNLPVELKTSTNKIQPALSVDGSQSLFKAARLTEDGLHAILESTPCIGEIKRSGKDAAGKPLEDEYYYVPEMDTDELRRETITGGLRGTGLRAVRRNHKQYYWKKPRH